MDDHRAILNTSQFVPHLPGAGEEANDRAFAYDVNVGDQRFMRDLPTGSWAVRLKLMGNTQLIILEVPATRKVCRLYDRVDSGAHGRFMFLIRARSARTGLIGSWRFAAPLN